MIESPGILYSIGAFLLVIGPLVFVHEMGHYLVARWFGTKVEKFSIGFGREIAGWTDKRGTRWKIGWMPLGGYVQFAGDLNAASQPDPNAGDASAEERAALFQFKPVGQRFLIILAGPMINFLFAIILFMGIFATYGQAQNAPVVSAIMEGSVADQAGFELGDEISAVDGRAIDRFDELADIVRLRPGQQMQFDILRDGRELSITAVTADVTVEDRFGNEARIGRLGVQSAVLEMETLGALQLPGAALTQTLSSLEMITVGLGQIISGRRSIEELGGPLRIAQFSGQTASLGLYAFLFFMAAISINLGFINLLPIPMLDGGHLVFYAAEAIRRRPIKPEAQEWAFRMGLAVLLSFMLMVTVIDLGSFGLWERLSGLIS
ncbi:RIP metalloprotease RseP [Parasphingopyxis lamellibrachiae]|uniref:Zinc metalloprotease n=1 Tax=Parasphingopyxis lamellibrachiae TaxID=680125 RepID=A0A3D9FEU7_9SPHN|nr:RIP metalloprotease RseP [Parasphingopyxis lamellibrachiae]RED15596.1 site-2 protease [Parasphingopyxis lamellibrachiae]